MAILYILSYLLAQLAIVTLVARSIKNEHDYYLTKQGLSLTFATLSIFATWFGVESCIGSSSAIYSGGLFSSRAEPFGYTICLFLMGAILAKRLWHKKHTTLADLLAVHYNSKIVEKICAFILLPAMIAWAGAQVRAFGYIISSVTTIDPLIATMIATTIVITYGCIGGLIGDVITDVMQGAVLIIGLIILLVVALLSFWDQGYTFATLDPSRLTLLPSNESFLQRADIWLVPIIGSLTTQEILFRIVGSRTPTIAQRSCFIAASIYLLIGMIPVVLGLIGPYLLPNIDHADAFLTEIAYQLLPKGLGIVFTGALISAILSTVDSTLLACSALITHNIAGGRYRSFGDRQQLNIAKLATATSGIGAFFIAANGRSVYQLVVFASSLGTAGLAVVTIIALYFPRFGKSIAASSALVVGMVATPLLEFVPDLCPAPYLSSIILSILAYLIGSIFDTSRV